MQQPILPEATDIFDKANRWSFTKYLRKMGFYAYFQPIEGTSTTEVVIDGKQVIMLGSNNYLGLTADPRVKQAAIDAVHRFGSSSSGSRLLNGTLTLHHELEERLARFLKKEAAVVFSTGYQTNLGTLSAIAGRRDVIVADRQNHASIYDGIRLGYADLKRFRHNDMEDLERVLAGSDPAAGKLIVVDGVFSMEGDLANLSRIVELKREYNARLMVDEAHGLGMLGLGGRGACEQLGVEDDVDLVMGTFSKSFASLGGVVAGPADVIEYIKHKARSMIFSASMTPASVGACLKALDIIEQEPERRQRLWHISESMRRELQGLGFDTGDSSTPVVPIIIGSDEKTFLFWRALLDRGVFTNPVISPAVPQGQQLIRTSYMATHTDAQLERVLQTFEAVGRETGVISARACSAPGPSRHAHRCLQRGLSTEPAPNELSSPSYASNQSSMGIALQS